MGKGEIKMKTINIHFEDKEHADLTKMKKDKGWRQFFLEGVGYTNVGDKN